MAPRKRPWFRVYVEIIWDRKIRRLPTDHRWLWVTALACARSSPIPGFLLLSEGEPMVEEDLVDAASLKAPAVRSGLKALESLGLIEWDATLGAWRIVKWEERQFESDETAKRTARHRSKERSINGDVAPPENRRQKTEDRDTPLPPQSGGATKLNPRAEGTNPRAVAERARQTEIEERQRVIDNCGFCDSNGWRMDSTGEDVVRCNHVPEAVPR